MSASFAWGSYLVHQASLSLVLFPVKLLTYHNATLKLIFLRFHWMMIQMASFSALMSTVPYSYSDLTALMYDLEVLMLSPLIQLMPYFPTRTSSWYQPSLLNASLSSGEYTYSQGSWTKEYPEEAKNTLCHKIVTGLVKLKCWCGDTYIPHSTQAVWSLLVQEY